MSMYWIIFIGFALLSWLVSSRLQNKFEKYSKIPMPNGMPENVGSCCAGIMNCVFTGCAPSRITIQLFLPGLIKWYGIKTLVK